MEVERGLGFEPTDREFEKLGYDIESRVPGTGKLRFIEVKGRVTGADTVTVTKNEILYSLNKPDDFILAIVEFLERHRAPRPLPAPAVPARAGLRRDQRQLRLRRAAGARGAAAMTPLKPSKPRIPRRPAASALAAPSEEQAFAEVLEMIQAARGRALAAVNTELIDLYWQVGEYISRKLETATWGEGVVDALARYLQRHYPNLRGFTRPNLFRMRQFFEAYKGDEKSQHW